MSVKNTNYNISLSYEYYNKGLELVEDGKHEQAINLFEKALIENPTHQVQYIIKISI